MGLPGGRIQTVLIQEPNNMNVQVGQTISGDQFDKTYPVGSTVSASDFANKYGETSNTPKVDNSNSWGANIGGTIGSIAGHVLGIPGGDLETGTPAGSMALGGAGGFAGGYLGDMIDQLVHGQQFDPGRAAQAGAAQGAYGLIPGGDEMKALPVVGKLASNFLGRTALRAGTGYLGAGGAAAINDIGSGKDAGQVASDFNNQGMFGGAANAIIPGIGDAFSGAGKALSSIPAGVDKRLAQTQFGLLAAEHPEVAALADVNPMQSLSNVRQAIQDTSDQVNQALAEKTGNVKQFMSSLLDAAENVPPNARGGMNKETVRQEYGAWLDNIRTQIASGNPIPFNTGIPGVNSVPSNTNSVRELPLNYFNQIKSAIGGSYQKDPVAAEMWGAAKKFITSKYGDMSPELQKLWSKQEALIHANENISSLKGAANVPSLGVGANLPQILTGIGAGGAFLTGHPLLGTLLGGGTAIANAMTHPEIANKVSQQLVKATKSGAKITPIIGSALQQLGVRAPQLINSQ